MLTEENNHQTYIVDCEGDCDSTLTKDEKTFESNTTKMSIPYKPRLAISHKLNKNYVSNLVLLSSREVCLQIVDGEEYLKFKAAFESFFFKILKTKFKEFEISFHNDLLDIVLKNIETVKIKDLKDENINKFNRKGNSYNHVDVYKRKSSGMSLLCDDILNFFRHTTHNSNNTRNTFSDSSHSKYSFNRVNKHPGVSHLLPQFIDELILAVTELINLFSNSCFNHVHHSQSESESEYEIFTKEFLQEILYRKLFHLYQRRDYEKKLREEADEYYEYYNIEKIIKQQKSQLQRQNDHIKNLSEARQEMLCVECKCKERSVVFYPCMHMLICEDCNNKIEISEECNKFCSKCEAGVTESKVLSF